MARETNSHTLMIPDAKVLHGGILIAYLFIAAALFQILAISIPSRRWKSWVYWGTGSLFIVVPAGILLRDLLNVRSGLDTAIFLAFLQYWPLLICVIAILVVVVNILAIKRDLETEYA